MKTKQTQKEILKKVENGSIHFCCFDCGDLYREGESYDGSFTCHGGVCEICGENKTISSARKIFGNHKFL